MLRLGGEDKAWAVFSSSGFFVFVMAGFILRTTSSWLMDGVMSSKIPAKTLGYLVLVFCIVSLELFH